MADEIVPPLTRSASWRPSRLLAATALLGLAVVSVPSVRGPILRWAGWALVADEPVQSADIIVVTIDADGAGVLEAADLVHSGISSRVAVFAQPPGAVAREFIHRGLAYDDGTAREVRQLLALGVGNIEEVPREVSGTEDEADALPDWFDRQQLRSVVVVSTSDHSRRLRRVLHRVMKNRRTRVTVRPARYSEFNPDQWWRTRAGIRTEIVELEKLLLDFVRHPVS